MAGDLGRGGINKGRKEAESVLGARLKGRAGEFVLTFDPDVGVDP